MTAGLAGAPVGRGHTCPETHARCSAGGREHEGEGPEVKEVGGGIFVGGSEDTGWSGSVPSRC